MFLTTRQRRSAKFAFALSGALMASTSALAQSPIFELADEPTKVNTPVGYIEMCRDDGTLCIDDYAVSDKTIKIAVTPELWTLLKSVNDYWNDPKVVAPTLDIDNHGVVEKWIPAKRGGKGDCEDIAMAKREQLIRAGLPREALQLTFVIEEQGLGHAVLSVQTQIGTYVLDNRTSQILVWNAAKLNFMSAMVGGKWYDIKTPKIGPWTTTMAREKAAATKNRTDDRPVPPMPIPNVDKPPVLRGTL